MSNNIVVTTENSIDKTFLFNEGRVIRYNISTNNQFKIGNIYIGRVQKVKKDINAVFVELTKDVIGFLPLNEVDYRFITNRVSDNNIYENDTIAVMISKEAIKTKPITLTCNLSVQGNYSIVHTDDNNIHLSGKLSKNIKHSIDSKLQDLLPLVNVGIIIRTNAGSADINDIREEIKINSSILNDVIKSINFRTCHSLIYNSAPAYIDHIRNIGDGLFDKIVTDNIDIYNELSSHKFNKPVELYNSDSLSLKALYSLERAHGEATSRKINLNCGGYIIIDVCEALTVIDVNSGKANYSSKKASVDIINKEAAKEIVHQLILRNISGIIIIDFISYKSNEEAEDLMSLLKKELRKDHLKSKVIDMTPLGLVEITREKKFSSFYDNLKLLEKLIDK